MIFFAIDPGPLGSDKHGWATYNPYTQAVDAGEGCSNEVIGLMLRSGAPVMAIEKIVGQGRARVGNETFDTVRAERDFERMAGFMGLDVKPITRSKARGHVAGQHANDSKVRKALIARFPDTAHWRGTHRFAALAVAVTCAHNYKSQEV